MWIFVLGHRIQRLADVAITPCPRHRQAWIGAAVLLVFGLGLPALRAQERGTPAIPPNGGLQVLSVSAYGVYYSTTLPSTGGFQPTNLGSDVGVGGSAQIGWTNSGQHSTFSLVYTPSYIGRIQYSSLDALNHALSLNATRRLARWNFGFSVSGNLRTFEESLFSPTVLSNVASVSANSADLSAAMLGRNSTNAQLVSILNSAPLVESPAQTLLYGERMLTSAAQASLSYSYSRHFSIIFNAGAGRNQHLGENQNDQVQSPYLLPTTTSGNASLGFSYALSSRTQFGATVTTSRVVSDLYDSYSTSSIASLGRTLGRRWFLQIHGGVGLMNPIRQTSVQPTSVLPTGPHPVASGSLGFRTFSHTFLGSYDRIVSDSYGVGATTSSTSSATWRWNRPGAGWWLEGIFSWQQLQGVVAGQNISSWRATASWGRQLGARVALLTQYVYLNYSGWVGNSFYSQPQSAMRVSVVWARQPALPR